jgi:hypothetical protein
MPERSFLEKDSCNAWNKNHSPGMRKRNSNMPDETFYLIKTARILKGSTLKVLPFLPPYFDSLVMLFNASA